jgi:hypothetical protein
MTRGIVRGGIDTGGFSAEHGAGVTEKGYRTASN